MLRTTVLALVLVTSLTGCTLMSEDSAEDGERRVVLATHDSFAMSQEVLDAFRDKSGITIDVRRLGDAGALTNQLVLTKDNPVADLAYGVDTTFASRALTEDVFAEYRSAEAEHGPQRYAIEDGDRLTAVDVGDVCVNIDPAALAAKGLAEPASYADLTRPEYHGMLVVEDPATSSPGLAFLLGTIAALGDGWQEYWTALKDRGVLVVSGWEEAYTQEFSGSAGKGPRPLVVSYASSPAAEIDEDGTPRTKALLDTCFRQVEYAGVLAGAANAEDARAVLDFLLSREFQEQVPDQMYVYPARSDVELPAAWQHAAPQPTTAGELDPAEIAKNRERWIDEWRALVQG
ncbi:thiamine ABC transporter substrate-binding protein [Actinophytocola sediminis]